MRQGQPVFRPKRQTSGLFQATPQFGQHLLLTLHQSTGCIKSPALRQGAPRVGSIFWIGQAAGGFIQAVIRKSQQRSARQE